MRCSTCDGTGVVLGDDDLKAAGELAVKTALEIWATDIYDPKPSDDSTDARRCKEAIDVMIRGGMGLHWTWEPSYEGDGKFEWCGAFVARCWSRIKPDIRKLCFASTYRLDRYGRAASVMGEEPKKPTHSRLIAELNENSKVLPFQPRAGDILLVGPKGYGSHICLVESFDASQRLFQTIEGNAYGRGPHGERQQGVVRQLRSLGGISYCARRLIRPSIDDLAL